MNVQKNVTLALLRTKLHALKLISPRKAGEEAFRLFITPPRRSVKISAVFEAHENLAFNFNGLTIRGHRVNHPQQKKVLLLHGFSSSYHHFEGYVQPLLDAGFEVLAFNAPAHGFSEGKTAHAVQYSEMIRQINELYGPVNGYVGHSFGGLSVCLALEQMEHQPDTRLVLIAPATETTTAIDSAFTLIGLQSKAIKAEMEKTIRRISGNDASWFSVTRTIPHIKASVLWVHDEDDDITPLRDALKVKQSSYPHVQFHITSGLGHHKVYRNPEVISHVVSFLSR